MVGTNHLIWMSVQRRNSGFFEFSSLEIPPMRYPQRTPLKWWLLADADGWRFVRPGAGRSSRVITIVITSFT
jgi:hypothetical protein